MVAGKKQKFVMRPPQVVRIGTKKTSFANFTEVCITRIAVLLVVYEEIICKDYLKDKKINLYLKII